MRSCLFLTLIILVSCVSDPQNIPPQISEDPVFGLSAEVDGSMVSMEAGVDGYILETGWDRDSLGIPFTESRLARQDCAPDCGPSITLRMYGLSDGTDAEKQLASILEAGDKSFAGPPTTPDSVEVSFTIQLPASQPPAYYWHSSAGSNPFYEETITSLYARDDQVSICLNTLANEHCFSTKCIDFTPSNSPQGCDVSMVTRMLPDSFLLIEALPAGEPPFQYNWQFGSRTVQSQLNKIIVKPPVSQGKVLVQVNVADATGCSAQLRQMIEINPTGVMVCPLGLTYEITEVPGIPVYPHGKAELVYTDANGLQYQSNLGFQDSDAHFSILSTSPYNPNHLGDPTRLLSLDISCSLFDAGGTSRLLFSTNEFRIGAAFPGD